MLSVPGAADVGELAGGRIKFVGIYLDKTSRLSGVKLSKIENKIPHAKLLIAAVVREEEVNDHRLKDGGFVGRLKPTKD
jgi:trk system potassium uptake protein TrkA